MKQSTAAGTARCSRAAKVEEVVGRERGGGGLLERGEERARRGGALARVVARVVPAARGGVRVGAPACREEALAARVAVVDGDLLLCAQQQKDVSLGVMRKCCERANVSRGGGV